MKGELYSTYAGMQRAIKEDSILSFQTHGLWTPVIVFRQENPEA